MTTSLSNATEAPTTSGFAALNLSEPVLRAIEEVGYTEPTPVQAATYPIAITGKDIIVQARTGTGKTAAFGIPLVDKLVNKDPWVQALVLAPTRELAVQSQRELARLAQFKGLHAVAIYGGAPMGRQIDELKSGAQLVSGTPGRVLDHLRRGTFDPSHLKVLVLDEMDEMLSMGFAKELNAILELIPPSGRRQTMCFSATVDGEIRRHAERHMHEPEMISLSSDGVAAGQISHHVYMVSGRDRIGDLVRVLEVEDPESAIVFCNMRSETERVAMGLKQAGFNADWLNGDLPQKDRERIMASTREGKLRYLVATDVAARGIDISHLTHVINFTFPESAAVYVHRTGRTGRAGRTGCAISLVGPEELGRLYYLRLEYKISPIERSLPTHGELKTRQEIDRIALLEAAFTDRANPNDLALARRLLTHPENERVLAGLLHTFFGTKEDVDDEAAAARRSKLGPDLDQAARVAREKERPRGRDRERSRERDDRPRVSDPSRERDRGREGRERGREGRDRELGARDRPLGAREREVGRDAEDSARDSGRDREFGPQGEQSARERGPGRERDRDRSPGREGEQSARDRESGRERNRGRDAETRDSGREGQQSARTSESGRERNRDRQPGREGEHSEREPGREGEQSAREGGPGRDRESGRDGEQRAREPGRDRNRGRERANESGRGARDRDSDPKRDQSSGSEPGDRESGRARVRSGGDDQGTSGSDFEGEHSAGDRDPARGTYAPTESSDEQRNARGERDSNIESGSAPRGESEQRRSLRENGRELRAERKREARSERGSREREPTRERSRDLDRTRNGAGDRSAVSTDEARDVAVNGAAGEPRSEDRGAARERNRDRGPRSAERERSKSRSGRESSAAAESGASPDAEPAEAADETSERPEREGSSSSRRRRRSRERSAERKSDVAPLTAAGDSAEDAEAGPASERVPAQKRARRAESATPLAAVDGELFPLDANSDAESGGEPTEPLEGLLYLNVGKRDGVRGPEVVRLLRDSCELARGQIGRVRVRDRYTFVDVPEGRLDGIITALSGQRLHDKPLAPERAKTAKT